MRGGSALGEISLLRRRVKNLPEWINYNLKSLKLSSHIVLMNIQIFVSFVLKLSWQTFILDNIVKNEVHESQCCL